MKVMKVEIVSGKAPIHIGQLFLGTVFLWNNEAYVKCTNSTAVNLHDHSIRQFDTTEYLDVAHSVVVKVGM